MTDFQIIERPEWNGYAVEVRYPGFEGPVGINERLAQSKGLSEETVRLLVQTHIRLRRMFWIASRITHRDERKRIGAIVQKIEFKLQRLWGFKQDPNFHSWFFRIPGCTCPKMDNQERIGTGYFIRTLDCPFHGEPE